MAKEYLDLTGLAYFWGKIKDYVDSHGGGGSVPADMEDYVTDKGTSGNWYYRKWKSGRVEAWFSGSVTCSATTAVSPVQRSTFTLTIPTGIFNSTPKLNISINDTTNTVFSVEGSASSKTNINGRAFRTNANTSTYTLNVAVHAWA